MASRDSAPSPADPLAPDPEPTRTSRATRDSRPSGSSLAMAKGARGGDVAAAGPVSGLHQLPNIFCLSSRRCWASSDSVAVGRASSRGTPMGSPVSSQ